MTDAGHEYLHPGYKKPYPIETVLRDLAAQEGCDGEPYDAMVFAAETITTLRAQLAEARFERDAVIAVRDMFGDRWANEKDRADRAEAALAAQIEAGPVAWVIPGDDYENCNGFIDAMAYEHGEFTRPLYVAQPHDRTALDRMLAETREKALREAAEILDDEGWLGMSKHRILALIEKEKTE